jgi:hypothetical protein
MTMTTQTILAEAAVAALTSPCSAGLVNVDGFGHVHALVERCVR